MRKVRLLGLLVAASFLIGCGQNPMAAIYDNDSKIASEGNSYNYYRDVKQDFDESDFTASVRGMDGMDTIWSYDCDSDSEIQINFDMANNVGDVKLVLISPDGELKTILECTNEETFEGSKSLNIKKGENRIKVVARDKAKFDVSLNIDKGSFERMGF